MQKIWGIMLGIMLITLCAWVTAVLLLTKQWDFLVFMALGAAVLAAVMRRMALQKNNKNLHIVAMAAFLLALGLSVLSVMARVALH